MITKVTIENPNWNKDRKRLPVQWRFDFLIPHDCFLDFTRTIYENTNFVIVSATPLFLDNVNITIDYEEVLNKIPYASSK